ncbi:hypothetical protein [Paludisphaera rhizosphaerae]|uniref:hypothetical protein n=1 Tax=Paludisphaera rhizosphaerae TaxID=2711216 RepID=UPI0013EB3A84|nr:hypothetical protein [Paludisphaera rhizosphaerae]
MDQAILVKEQITAGVELVRKVNAVMPISAAFWLKETDVPGWYLFIASDALENADPRKGYRIVREAVDAMNDGGIDLFQVKVIPSSNPFARAAREIVHGSTRTSPHWLGPTPFGDRLVEGACIYPANVLDPVPS